MRIKQIREESDCDVVNTLLKKGWTLKAINQMGGGFLYLLVR